MRPVLQAEPLDVPGQLVMDLEAGEWVVFERVGSTSSAGFVTTSRSHGSRIDHVTVVNADTGRSVVVEELGFVSQSVERGNDIYEGARRFDIDTPGRYLIAVSTAEQTKVFVGPSLGGLFVEALPAILLTLVGFLMLLVGIVMWARAWTRRQSAEASALGRHLPPPNIPTNPPPPVSQAAIFPSSSQSSRQD